MKKPDKTDLNALLEQLTMTVGYGNIIITQSSPDKATPYLEESRGRKIGKALAVVFPNTTAEVSKVVSACRYYKVPMVPQGGNTGRCLGALCEDDNGVVINLKNLNRIRDIDIQNRTITVEAGASLWQIEQALADSDLFFPLALWTKKDCQLGGNLSTNAGGVNVLRYGNTRELTLGIEAVISNGNVLNDLYGLRKNNTGYDLKNLMIGAEGTLGIITAATLKLYPKEKIDEQAFVGFNQIEDAITYLNVLQNACDGLVSTYELLPKQALTWIKEFQNTDAPIPNNQPWYVWYRMASSYDEATDSTSLAKKHQTIFNEQSKNGLIANGVIAKNNEQKQAFANLREQAVAVQKQGGALIKFDISVPISSIPKLISEGEKAAQFICPNTRAYPFGHVGDGNIHFNFANPENIPINEFITAYSDALHQAIYDIVDGLDGSFSAEHGIGSWKLDEMLKYKDPIALDLMRRIKHALDPFDLMNPGKVVPKVKKNIITEQLLTEGKVL